MKSVVALRVAWGLAVTVAVILAVASLDLSWSRDESAFVYVAQGILKGEIPYLDRWDHKGPVLYLIYSVGLLASPTIGMWFVNSTFMVGSAVILFILIRGILGTLPALLGASILLVAVPVLVDGDVELYALPFQLLAL